MPEEQCIFCMIAEGKIQAVKIYEDNDVLAFLDIRPATEGHMNIIPKQHAPLFSMLPNEIRAKLFNVALSLGAGLVKKLGATGVSYIINEGAGANQRVPHASMKIIPRYENDGVVISWEQKEWNQEEISKYLSKVLAKLQGEAEPPKEESAPPVVEEKKEEEKKEEDVIVEEERIPRYW